MTDLMVYAGTPAEAAALTRTGGIPLVPPGFSWPRCRSCDGNMQFLAQLTAADTGAGAVVVFLCQNDPGMCDDWDATAGGNQALVLPDTTLAPALPPADGDTTLDEVSAITVLAAAGDDYEQARDDWATSAGRPVTDVLGQLGGTPAWLQADETPTCPTCAEPMTFTAQFEEGHDHRTAVNFGGGAGYLFACWPCHQAAFLWQR